MSAQTSTSSRATPAVGSDHRRRWWILAVLGIAQLMVVLDASVVNIALPSAQKALHFSNNNRQWIVTAYALAFGSLLLIGGRVSDLFGRKRTFVGGAIGFAVASAFGGAAQSFDVLVAARALQGMFAALLAPAALSLVTTTFTDPDERGKAFAVWGAIGGGSAAFGLLLGGVLTQSLSWRWTLFVNLGFAIPAALGAFALLQSNLRTVKPQIDVPGTLTATGGLFALVYGLAQAQTHGWGSSTTVGFLATGVLLLAGFVAIQARGEHPLLPLPIVLERNRGGSLLALGVLGAGMFGVFLFLTYYLQRTLGYSPLKTGLAFVPMTAALVIMSAVTSTRVLPRTGPRPLFATGMALAAVGLVLLAQLGVHSSYATQILPGLILAGAGIGMVYPPATNIATLGVNAPDAGAASAMANTAPQVGGSIGTALLSTLAASATSSYLTGTQASANLVAHAAVHGYTTAFWWSAGIFAAGALVTGLLVRGKLREPAPGTQPNAQPLGAV
ncbi:MAG TPA: MFS transporter [Solirubrobacteraceae bacterium]|nr:MFS transporter [Solirubrobacteraceae bacterium]